MIAFAAFMGLLIGFIAGLSLCWHLVNKYPERNGFLRLTPTADKE